MTRTKTFVARLLAICLIGLFGAAAETSAQGVQTGSIRGTVVDSQGLPVGNVTVTLPSPRPPGQRPDHLLRRFLTPPRSVQSTTTSPSNHAVSRPRTNLKIAPWPHVRSELHASGGWRGQHVQVVAKRRPDRDAAISYFKPPISSACHVRARSCNRACPLPLTTNTPNAGHYHTAPSRFRQRVRVNGGT